MIYLVLAVLALAAVAVAMPMKRRNHRLDEVDRFYVARSLTTTWATKPQPTPPVAESGDDLTD